MYVAVEVQTHRAQRMEALAALAGAFVRLQVGRTHCTERVSMNIQRVVEKTIETLAPSLPQGVSVETRLQAPDAKVLGDPRQIRQIVAALCIHAIQAVGGSGRVRLDLRALHIDVTQSFLRGELAAGRYARLSIKGRGSSPSANIVEGTFEPFSNALGERPRTHLSKARSIVDELGGMIDVRSEPGAGMRVMVWLPIAVPSNPQTTRGNGEVVLIVDDEPLLLELAVQRLTELGYTALAYSSSQAALQALIDTGSRIDLVLTDENMPEMSGSELVAAIRAKRIDVPVIMMSGDVTAALQERARAAGVSELLGKPLRETSLAAALTRCLRLKAGP
jgi:CheY-like chemotaxis protein